MDHVNRPLPYLTPGYSLRDHLWAACKAAEAESPATPEAIVHAFWDYTRQHCSTSDEVARGYFSVFLALLSDLLATGAVRGAWCDEFPSLVTAWSVHAES